MAVRKNRVADLDLACKMAFGNNLSGPEQLVGRQVQIVNRRFCALSTIRSVSGAMQSKNAGELHIVFDRFNVEFPHQSRRGNFLEIAKIEREVGNKVKLTHELLANYSFATARFSIENKKWSSRAELSNTTFVVSHLYFDLFRDNLIEGTDLLKETLPEDIAPTIILNIPLIINLK